MASARWALCRSLLKITHKQYIAQVSCCIASFTKVFGVSPLVRVKLYKHPEWRPTHFIEGYEHAETAYKILSELKMLTSDDWTEAKIVETILYLPSSVENKNGVNAVFASIAAKGCYPRQMTFYIQGIDAEELCRQVFETSVGEAGSLRVYSTQTSRGIDISFRGHHHRR